MQRRSIWVTLLFGVAIVVTALNHTRKVHATSGQDQLSGCSVASLKGTYAYSSTGVNNDVGGPIAAIGIEVINGDGKRGIIRSTRSTNGEIQDWTDFPWPSGS
jgi:hypothetical protein